MDDNNHTKELKPTIENLSKAIYTVNRHAKTATNPKFLYLLKKKALQKLINDGKGKKVGLHFSQNPKFSQQQSDVLISLGDYVFHMPPTKEDFENLPHLGTLNHSYRNPRAQMSLYIAKQLLQNYTGLKEKLVTSRKQAAKPVFKRLGESYF
ncbi:YkyB family protein [Bacillus sp. CLL-7-23]|uniref:YkyB family protein n=1 Tax=Bacillus changyiensis TaxID=3004103 RepID=A0ABT4X4E9_9BACI|nr:YkyB family protein [Bacillus changyiensis]MDA7026257.1 YkyB family protein [Bacillus changyiensis]